MKKQLTILLILTFVLGLASINFTKNSEAQTELGLIAYWDLNQDSIDTIIDKMGSYNGENEGGIPTDTGYSGSAMIFNFYRDNSMIYGGGIMTSNLPAMDKFTVSYRIKIDNLPQDANEFRILASGGSFYSELTGSILTYGIVNNGANNLNISSLNNGAWHNFIFVYDGQKLKFYQDGSLAKSSYASGSIKSDNWKFGATSWGPHSTHIVSDVQLDEIKIYNIDLTSSQILEENNYNTLSCANDIWECGNWGQCSIDGQQNRVCTQTYNCPIVSTHSPATVQSCTPECLENSWSCGGWGVCASNGTQTRICTKKYNCEGGASSPAITQYCTYIPTCASSDWSCTDWSLCSLSGTQVRTCNKTSNCQGGVSSPATSQSCTYVPKCTSYSWSCGSWSECSSNGTKTRECNKTSNCEGGTPSPATTQSCSYAPSCTSDTWQCGSWGTCSPQGIQTRSCDKTYDCPSTETASPATSQYCEAPNKPDQTPSDDLEIVNQDSIIKATVKLICPVSRTMASQGSGTVISSDGTILTNKHVVDGTVGCLVGFINNYDDEPYFNDRQIADIYSISSDSDIAILKLRNPYSRNLTAINITGSNSNNLSLGDQITTYGYPAKFGRKITYTSGDFSGVDGNYLKTTAIIEFGNSGGGAYLKNGTFIGIPSAVMKGELNSLGYILSVNKINSWLNNSPIAYNNDSNNNYSRVSILDNIDLNTLGSLGLFIADEDRGNEKVVDGDIIQCQNSSNPSAVYIVKIVGDTKYIRHIVSLDIFNYYGHLKWENLKQVDSLDNYSLSSWVRVDTDPNEKVYEINGDQTMHWINMTAENFLTHGGSESAIFNVNKGELDLYTAGADVMSL